MKRESNMDGTPDTPISKIAKEVMTIRGKIDFEREASNQDLACAVPFSMLMHYLPKHSTAVLHKKCQLTQPSAIRLHSFEMRLTISPIPPLT